MKRSIRLVAGLAIAGSVVGSILMTPPAALAAAAKCGANQIQVGIPVLIGGNPCIANDPKNGGAIIVYLRQVLQLCSIAVGLVIVLMLVIGGIQYLIAVGDPTGIKSAKNRVTNAIIALVLFLTMFAILQFLIPGGMLTA